MSGITEESYTFLGNTLGRFWFYFGFSPSKKKPKTTPHPLPAVGNKSPLFKGHFLVFNRLSTKWTEQLWVGKALTESSGTTLGQGAALLFDTLLPDASCSSKQMMTSVLSSRVEFLLAVALKSWE